MQSANMYQKNALPSGTMKNIAANLEPRLPTATGGPILQFDLLHEAEQLRQEPAWSSGRNAKTLVKHADFRLVLTVMKAGTRMHQHRAKGSVSIQPVFGHVRIHVLDNAFTLRPGLILSLDPNLAHDVEAIEESAFAVSIAWPADSPAVQPGVHRFEANSNAPDWMQDESVWN